MKLFILRGIKRAFLHRYFGLVKTLGRKHVATTQHKGNDTSYLEVKKKSGRRDPVMRKILVLYFFQFFLVFLCWSSHNKNLCCKNKGYCKKITMSSLQFLKRCSSFLQNEARQCCHTGNPLVFLCFYSSGPEIHFCVGETATS